MRYGLVLVTPPDDEPVTLEELKDWLRIDGSSEDAELTQLIVDARLEFEEQTYRQLVTATWRLILDQFPAGRRRILLPKAPLASVSSIKYYDSAGVLQTWDAANYAVSTSRDPGRILPAAGKFWPTLQLDRPDAVEVEFVAGYGEPSAVPGLVKRAVSLMAGGWYQHREELTCDSVREIPRGAARIMGIYDLGDELSEYGAADRYDTETTRR